MGLSASKYLLALQISTFNEPLILSHAAGVSIPANHPLSEVITQIEVMRDNVRNLHSTDAEKYDKVAVHCEDQTKMLFDNESGGYSGYISEKSNAIKNGSSAASSAKALMEEATVEFEKDSEELKRRNEDEETAKKRWNSDKSKLNDELDEATLAKKSLTRAAEILGINTKTGVANDDEHNFNEKEDASKSALDELMENMRNDVDSTITDLTTRRKEGNYARNKGSKHYVKNRDRLVSEIGEDKLTMVSEKTRMDENSEKVIENEKQLKQYSTQLHELTAFCERQAHDWDQAATARKDDDETLTMAVNILTCGKKDDCGAIDPAAAVNVPVFLQEFQSSNLVKKQLHSNTSKSKSYQKRNTIRHLIQLGKRNSNNDSNALKQLSLLQTRGPLDGAIELLKDIIQKMTVEQKKDTEAMGPCAASLQECTVERDQAMQEIDRLKMTLEQLSRAQKEDTIAYQETSDEKIYQSNLANTTELIQIPETDSTYNNMKDNLSEQRNRLFDAVKVLRTHFGISAADIESLNKKDAASQASSIAVVGDNNPATNTKESISRSVSDRGDTQSSGVMLVKLLSQKLDQRDGELSSLRKNYLESRQDLQSEANNAHLIAGENQEKARHTHADMLSDKVEFGETLMQLQDKVDQAAASGRCVQQLEPCGVQVDRRAARAKTIQDLKEAYKILADEEEWTPSL